MSRKKKIILGFMIALTVLVGAVCAYAVNFVNKAHETTDKMFESVERVTTSESSGVDPDKPVNFDATEPFSILLLGIDTGGLGRTDRGRSDTMMVVTVNPKQKKSIITSLDRDIYTSIVGNGTVDKLNHAYAFGGVGMSMDSVEALLNIPINHYVTINFDGFSELVNAVGGIEINNKLNFVQDDLKLTPGTYHLNGKQALSYSRFRHYDPSTGLGDPEGDVGRQKRQREVVMAIVNKLLSINSITSYQKILDAVGNNTKTDLQWNDMLKIIEGYTGAAKQIEQIQLQGDSAMIDSIYYQLLHQDNLLEIQNKLRAQLNLPANSALDMSKYAANQFFGSVQSSETTGQSSAAPVETPSAPVQNNSGNGGTSSNNGGGSNGSSVTKPSSSAPTPPSSTTPSSTPPTTPSTPPSSSEPEPPATSSSATPEPATSTTE